MTPIENSDDNISTLNTLTERFGVEKAYELINIYEDNWITEYDLDRIVAVSYTHLDNGQHERGACAPRQRRKDTEHKPRRVQTV